MKTECVSVSGVFIYAMFGAIKTNSGVCGGGLFVQV